MKKLVLIATALLASCVLAAQKPSTSPTFEVATIKPVESTPKSARYIVMQGPHRVRREGLYPQAAHRRSL